MRHRTAAIVPTLVFFFAPFDSGASIDLLALGELLQAAEESRAETIDITLYGHVGWVREVRKHRILPGEVEIPITNLPQLADGAIELRAVDDMGPFRVLDLDYRPSRATPDAATGSATARVESEAGDRLLEVSYVTGAMAWRAAYVVTLPSTGDRARLVGTANIMNRSGRTFDHASVRLVSGVTSDYAGGMGGDPEPPVPFAPLARVGGLPPSGARPLIELQALTLATTTVRNENNKQVEFLVAPSVPVRVEHAVTFHRSCDGTRTERSHASIVLAFRNDAPSGLGGFLESGQVRVLAEQDERDRVLIGTGAIADVEPGELVRVPIGSARDVIASRSIVAYDGDRRTNEFERTYRVVLVNRKLQPVVVTVRDAGGTRIVRSSHAFTTSASETTCSLAVPAGSSAELVYTAKGTCE